MGNIETRKNMTNKELKEAFQDCKIEFPNAVRLSNGWFVKAEKIYPQPARPGPAWHFIYKVVSPTGKTFGGQSRIDSAVYFASNFDWNDDYYKRQMAGAGLRDNNGRSVEQE
jgi:hypothetical protein